MGFLKDVWSAMMRSPYDLPPPPRPTLTPEMVEDAIERAGRAEVFALARQNGWTDGNPPMWAWYQFASEVEAKKQEAPYTPSPPHRN